MRQHEPGIFNKGFKIGRDFSRLLLLRVGPVNYVQVWYCTCTFVIFVTKFPDESAKKFSSTAESEIKTVYRERIWRFRESPPLKLEEVEVEES